MTIVTNNIPRDIIAAHELTTQERQQFDYLDWEAIDDGVCDAQFFRYRGELYALDQFCRVISPDAQRCHPMECAEPAFQGWDGYLSDSFFSGMLVKYADDFERIVIATYTS